jgi:rod shape-determining protein MreC
MRQAQPRISVVALSWRGFFARFALISLLAVSLAMLVLAKTQGDTMRKARFAALDALSAVTGTIAKPAAAVQAGADWIREMANLRAENTRLQQENARLRQWQSVASELGNENMKLRALMKVAPAGRESYIAARVALSHEGPFGRFAVVNVGKRDGVGDDFAVINEAGLVGRVLETGDDSARILLLTDAASRIPVISEESRERAIAVGANGSALQLLYLPEKGGLKVGERIVTTTDGGVLPPGLAVGTVTKIEKNIATVEPFLDSHRLEYVSVVDYRH